MTARLCLILIQTALDGRKALEGIGQVGGIYCWKSIMTGSNKNNYTFSPYPFLYATYPVALKSIGHADMRFHVRHILPQ